MEGILACYEQRGKSLRFKESERFSERIQGHRPIGIKLKTLSCFSPNHYFVFITEALSLRREDESDVMAEIGLAV